jgi:hypothetical protein
MHFNDAIQDGIFLSQGMHPLQSGFCKKRSTEDALRLATTMIESRARRGLATHVAFLDLASAFCSVPHYAIRQALKRFNVPEWAINMMMHIDDHGTTRVITDHGLCDPFPEETGVRQGDILSPVKFVMWADALLTWLDQLDDDVTIPDKTGSIRRAFHALFFADDMMAVSATQVGLQAKLSRIDAFLTHFGVSINERKSFYTSSEQGFQPKQQAGLPPKHGLYLMRGDNKVWLQA